MTSVFALYDLVARMAAAQPDGRRRLSGAVDRRFLITMRNDYLTPRGRPYKWSEVTAIFDRSVADARSSIMVPVQYTWRSVQARSGAPNQDDTEREWTFAQGQQFRSVLLHTSVVDAPDPLVTSEPLAAAQPPGAGPAAAMVDGASGLTLDIGYPQLPKSPAVDLLLMLTWDVITMEMMCTHMATTPQLRVPGRPANIKRISGSWAKLRFSAPGTTGSFHNSDMTATCLGFGLQGGRPAAAYTFQCLDCMLSVRTGAVEQDGRSSFWGTMQVDLETGDVVAGEMIEIILATLNGADGHKVPVQKRRIVRMQADADQRMPDDPSGRATDDQERTLVAQAVGHLADVTSYLQWQLSALRSQPDTIAPVAHMGFRSMVGIDLPDAIEHLREMREDLRAWAEGDEKARDSFRESILSHRQILEGLLGFGRITVDQAARIWPNDVTGLNALQARMVATERRITELLAVLARLEG